MVRGLPGRGFDGRMATIMEQTPPPTDDPQALLRRYGRTDDAAIDLATAALALAALGRPDAALLPYRAHLRTLAVDVTAAAQSESLDLAARVHTLNTVLFEDYGYAGDSETYNDLRNADLMSVIDRRRGLPIALGILYIHAARAQGWAIEGVNFPGHFLLRLIRHCRSLQRWTHPRRRRPREAHQDDGRR